MVMTCLRGLHVNRIDSSPGSARKVVPTIMLLDRGDINEIIQIVGIDNVMTKVIARLINGMSEAHEHLADFSPPRDGFRRDGPAGGVIEWMPYRQNGSSVTIKTVAYSPANPANFGLPTITASIARFDDATGELTVLADGGTITAIRTGAASAIASQALARPDSTILGVVGCGAQAVTQLHGLSLLFPLDTVLAWDIDASRIESLSRRIAFTGLDVHMASPQRIASLADIVVTATSVGVGQGPVFPDGDTTEHLHVNAVGADLVGKTELPLGLLKRALVCPDHPEQALREGESQVLERSELGPTLGQICADPAIVRAAQRRLTVFDSTGAAIEDHLALDVFLDLAAELAVMCSTRIQACARPTAHDCLPHDRARSAGWSRSGDDGLPRELVRGLCREYS
jgi:L-lysine cyclodeaminase